MSETPVAVFDLDGTITRGDTLKLFLKFSWRHGPTRPWLAAGLPRAMRIARQDVARRGEFKALVLAMLHGGRSRARLAAIADAFVARVLADQVKPGARAALARHRAAGHRLLLATASPDLWVEPFARAENFDAVLCTRLAWTADDRFAGRLDGPNLLHAAKRDGVVAWMAQHAGGVAPHAAYTDHHHDLPMLLLADRKVAVDPTPKLAAEAAARGIPIERWA
jgi:HAD superfamily hydrolase (TIGR01490 family)